MAFTRVLGPGIHTEADIKTNSINATGIITATGGFDGPFTKLNVTGDVVVGGALTVGGVLTYEDVTNIDAIGVITARSDIKVGTGATITPAGGGFFAGILTATNIKAENHLTVDGGNLTLLNGDLYVNDKIIHYGDIDTRIQFDTDTIIFEADGEKLRTTDKGIKVGTGATIETNGQATFTGIVTALDFQKADGSSLGVGAGGTWSSYSAGIATSKSVGINTTNLDDTRITGVGNSFQGLYISNGMMVNDARLDGDHFIGADVNGMMVGPVNITGTLTVEGNYVVF